MLRAIHKKYLKSSLNTNYIINLTKNMLNKKDYKEISIYNKNPDVYLTNIYRKKGITINKPKLSQQTLTAFSSYNKIEQCFLQQHHDENEQLIYSYYQTVFPYDIPLNNLLYHYVKHDISVNKAFHYNIYKHACCHLLINLNDQIYQKLKVTIIKNDIQHFYDTIIKTKGFHPTGEWSKQFTDRGAIIKAQNWQDALDYIFNNYKKETVWPDEYVLGKGIGDTTLYYEEYLEGGAKFKSDHWVKIYDYHKHDCRSIYNNYNFLYKMYWNLPKYTMSCRELQQIYNNKEYGTLSVSWFNNEMLAAPMLTTNRRIDLNPYILLEFYVSGVKLNDNDLNNIIVYKYKLQETYDVKKNKKMDKHMIEKYFLLGTKLSRTHLRELLKI
jgi:hypothetical protein